MFDEINDTQIKEIQQHVEGCLPDSPMLSVAFYRHNGLVALVLPRTESWTNLLRVTLVGSILFHAQAVRLVIPASRISDPDQNAVIVLQGDVSEHVDGVILPFDVQGEHIVWQAPVRDVLPLWLRMLQLTLMTADTAQRKRIHPLDDHRAGIELTETFDCTVMVDAAMSFWSMN